MTPGPANGRVVVGIDGSKASLDALARAARQADLTGARLELLASWEWPTGTSSSWGPRRHGEFVGMLIGSVSEYCTTNTHCPVLVHRPSA